MTEKKLSTLGYLMDRLGLSTAGLARRLHVDASLVSKWRSGNRRLHVKSVYFEDICEMFLEQDRAALCDALRSLIPLEEAKAPMDTAILLRRVLTDRHFTVPRAFTLRTEAVCTAEIAVYTSTEGRRQAISDLLDVAEAMEDGKKAAALYRRAMEAGSIRAMGNLAWCYSEGIEVEQDQVQATELYRRGAEAGNPRSMSSFGYRLLHGSGIGKDDKQAVIWLRRAAEQEQDNAMCNLGWCYERVSVGFRNPHLRLRGRFRFFLLLWRLEQFACPRVTGTFRLCVCRNLTKQGIDKALSGICSDVFWRSSVANHVSRLEQIQGDRLIREPEEEILPGRGCRPRFGGLLH